MTTGFEAKGRAKKKALNSAEFKRALDVVARGIKAIDDMVNARDDLMLLLRMNEEVEGNNEFAETPFWFDDARRGLKDFLDRLNIRHPESDIPCCSSCGMVIRLGVDMAKTELSPMGQPFYRNACAFSSCSEYCGYEVET
jgi:hypothetical protein